MIQVASVYFKRFECRPPLISFSFSPDTKIVIVIPCYDEPDLIGTLQSLAAGDPPRYPVEVIIVVNEPKTAANSISQRNRRTAEEAQAWSESQSAQWITFRVLYITDLPPKHAGVGLARKIGMDEALRRFASINYDGWIVCLDADCQVAENYVAVLENEFLDQEPRSGTIYFEHRLSSVENPQLRVGIIHYELFLRYYINALRYAGFPYAMHTVGSSMAVQATTYARTGGMNRRKAGEDFYFLHKVAPQEKLREITTTVVYPSSRISNRVPFGTGRAQTEWLQGGRRHTYPSVIFEELKTFFSFAPEQYHQSEKETIRNIQQLPGLLPQFLQEIGFVNKLVELKAGTKQPATFERRFFAWFDGFMVLKYVHYAVEHGYGSPLLVAAAQELLMKLGWQAVPSEAEALLHIYRSLDRSV